MRCAPPPLRRTQRRPKQTPAGPRHPQPGRAAPAGLAASPVPLTPSSRRNSLGPRRNPRRRHASRFAADAAGQPSAGRRSAASFRDGKIVSFLRGRREGPAYGAARRRGFNRTVENPAGESAAVGPPPAPPAGAALPPRSPLPSRQALRGGSRPGVLRAAHGTPFPVILSSSSARPPPASELPPS